MCQQMMIIMRDLSDKWCLFCVIICIKLLVNLSNGLKISVTKSNSTESENDSGTKDSGKMMNQIIWDHYKNGNNICAYDQLLVLKLMTYLIILNLGMFIAKEGSSFFIKCDSENEMNESNNGTTLTWDIDTQVRK